MPQSGSRAGLTILVAAMLAVQGCHKAAPTNPVPPRRTSTGTSAASSAPAALRFRRAPFDLPSAIQREVGVADGGTIYLTGGLNGTDVSVATVERVDTSRGLVQVVGQMPHRFHDGAGAWIGTRLFVFGGGTGTGSDVVQSFSPSRGRAEVEGSLPLALSDLSTAVLGGVTYLIGGYDGVEPQRMIYATSDGRRFNRAGLLPVGLRYAAVAAVGATVVIAGGETARGPSAGILAFDPSTGTVTTVGHLPQGVGHASAFAAGGVVYVVGGVDASGRTLRAIVSVDTGSGRVRSAGRLPAPLSDAAAVVVGQQAWLFGGLRGRPVSEILVALIAPR